MGSFTLVTILIGLAGIPLLVFTPVGQWVASVPSSLNLVSQENSQVPPEPESTKDTAKTWIDMIINFFTGNLKAGQDPVTGYLRTTDEEMQDLTSSGKDLVGEGIDMALALKKFVMAMIHFFSPMDVNPIVGLGLTIASVVLIATALLRRLVGHAIIFFIIGVGIIIALFVLQGV